MFLEKIKKNIWCFWDKIKRNAVFLHQNNAKAPSRSLGMEVENIPEMDKADCGLIIASHVELQFVGFD